MTFDQILAGLKNGHLFVRQGWNDSAERVFIVRQIPQTLSQSIVQKMTSLPLSAIDAITGWENMNDTQQWLNFHDQVLLVRLSLFDTNATSYTPTWEDIFASDWEEYIAGE